MVYAGGPAWSFYRLLISQIKSHQSSLCLLMIHAGGGTLSFYRPWLWSEQACIEAIHVACLVADFTWNQLGIYIGSCKKKPEALQKQSRPEQRLWAAGCQQGTPVVATAVALFYGVCKGSSLIIFIGSSYLKSTLICHPLCHCMCHAGGGTLSFYRPWLLPEQACIEANHVAGLVAHVIWNQLGIHIGSGKKKPEFLDAWNTVETL